jgi:hypothetical protein
MQYERPLSAEKLDEFRRLYKAEFGAELEQDDLERKARTLLNLYISLYSSASDAARQVQLTEE